MTSRRLGPGGVRALAARPGTVVWVAVAMIAVQLAYRSWALAGGWFLIDDYGFLSGAVGQKLTLHYLFQPHNDHLQPLGFLVAWVVGQSSPFNWGLATAITMVIQALADVAALAFLLRLAGRRWGILVPLGFYLFSVVTLPGFLWWCVASVQVPQQLAAFLAMTFHLEYARSRRKMFVTLTVLALVLGMLSDVKVAFVVPGLLFLSLYTSQGTGWRSRLVDGLWGQKLAWTTYGVLFAGYLALYWHLSPMGGRASSDWQWVFEAMLRYTLGPTLLGGPWEWGQMRDTPLVPAAPPEYAVTITWVVLVLLFLRAVRRYRPAAWALAPLVVCLVVNVLMVSAARGTVSGRILGLEVRYLGDLAPVASLMLAVLATGLRARPARPEVAAGFPLSRGQRVIASLLVVAVAAGVALSTSRYVANWHSQYPAREYTQNVIRASRHQALVLVDVPVPLTVIPGVDRPSHLFKPLGDRVQAWLQGNDLAALDDRGVPHPAAVVERMSTDPGGVEGCGHRVGVGPTTIQLHPVPGATPLGDLWWGSVGYLASADGAVQLGVGDTSIRMDVRRGPHTYLFLGNGMATDVRLDRLTRTLVCVDTVHLGDLVPLGSRIGGS